MSKNCKHKFYISKIYSKMNVTEFALEPNLFLKQL